MLRSRVIIATSETVRNPMFIEFELIAKKAFSQAVARQKALGLPHYFMMNGRVYGRAPNGRFVSTKK
jgi:hypothetical protein